MHAVLLQAGGIGIRTGYNIPKQFIPVKEKPIIAHTLECFQNNDSVDEIYISCLPDWITTLRMICKNYNFTKVQHIFDGGKNIFESTKKCIDGIQQNINANPLILIHEAVRPLVTSEMIENSFYVAEKFGNAVACYEQIDETASIENNKITSLNSNKNLFVIQNPHTFRLKKLIWAYQHKNENFGYQGTAILMNRLGETLYCSKGDRDCFKITYEEDIRRFEMLLNQRNHNQ